MSSLDGGCVVVPWSVWPWGTGAQLPLASNTVFSRHVFVDGGGATPEGGGATTPLPGLTLLRTSLQLS